MPQGVLLKQRSFVIQEKLKHLLLPHILREATDDASRKSLEKLKKNQKPRKPYFDFLWYITLIYCELWYSKIAIENQDFKLNSLPSHNISI